MFEIFANFEIFEFKDSNVQGPIFEIFANFEIFEFKYSNVQSPIFEIFANLFLLFAFLTFSFDMQAPSGCALPMRQRRNT